MTNTKVRTALAGLISLVLLIAPPLFAEGPSSYKPLFVVDLPFDPSAAGNVVTDYMKAATAKDIQEAKKRWETFSNEHSNLDLIEDLTDMTLLRQAAYELSRIYYLLGENAKGDKELLRAFSIVAYEIPNGDKMRRWCTSMYYCDVNVPGNIKNAPQPGVPGKN